MPNEKVIMKHTCLKKQIVTHLMCYERSGIIFIKYECKKDMLKFLVGFLEHKINTGQNPKVIKGKSVLGIYFQQ